MLISLTANEAQDRRSLVNIDRLILLLGDLQIKVIFGSSMNSKTLSMVMKKSSLPTSDPLAVSSSAVPSNTEVTFNITTNTEEMVAYLGENPNREIVIAIVDLSTDVILVQSLAKIYNGYYRNGDIDPSSVPSWVHNNASGRDTAGAHPSTALTVAFTPDNYSPANQTVESHLQAIDNALASAGSANTIIGESTLIANGINLDFTLTEPMSAGNYYRGFVYLKMSAGGGGNYQLLCDDGAGTMDTTASNYTVGYMQQTGGVLSGSGGGNANVGPSRTDRWVRLTFDMSISPDGKPYATVRYGHESMSVAPLISEWVRTVGQTGNVVTKIRFRDNAGSVNLLAGSYGKIWKTYTIGGE